MSNSVKIVPTSGKQFIITIGRFSPFAVFLLLMETVATNGDSSVEHSGVIMPGSRLPMCTNTPTRSAAETAVVTSTPTQGGGSGTPVPTGTPTPDAAGYQRDPSAAATRAGSWGEYEDYLFTHYYECTNRTPFDATGFQISPAKAQDVKYIRQIATMILPCLSIHGGGLIGKHH